MAQVIIATTTRIAGVEDIQNDGAGVHKGQ